MQVMAFPPSYYIHCAQIYYDKSIKQLAAIIYMPLSYFDFFLIYCSP